MFRARNVRGNFWEGPRCKMKNSTRGCPLNLILRPMCQNRIFPIWVKFGPMGPGWLAGLAGWPGPRILVIHPVEGNEPVPGPHYNIHIAGDRLQDTRYSIQHAGMEVYRMQAYSGLRGLRAPLSRGRQIFFNIGSCLGSRWITCWVALAHLEGNAGMCVGLCLRLGPWLV